MQSSVSMLSDREGDGLRTNPTRMRDNPAAINTNMNLTPVGYSMSLTFVLSISNGAMVEDGCAVPFVSRGLLLWMETLDGVFRALLESLSDLVDEVGSAIVRVSNQLD